MKIVINVEADDILEMAHKKLCEAGLNPCMFDMTHSESVRDGDQFNVGSVKFIRLIFMSKKEE